MSLPDYNYLLLEQEDSGVTVVTINRASKLNAMNTEMMTELTDCFRKLSELSDVRVVVLTGTGKGFMAGADIEGYHGFAVGDFMRFQNRGREMYRAIEQCAKPVIAAVNGFALGGGFELALACDLIVASEKAKFGLPEVKLGLIPGGGGIQKALRVVGPYYAKELTMTGRFLSAAEAKELKFVSQITAHEDLMPQAMAMARDMARKAPLALQALKVLVDEGRDASLETAQAYDRAYLTNLFLSKDAAEGIAAFVEKREPNFHGH